MRRTFPAAAIALLLAAGCGSTPAEEPASTGDTGGDDAGADVDASDGSSDDTMVDTIDDPAPDTIDDIIAPPPRDSGRDTRHDVSSDAGSDTGPICPDPAAPNVSYVSRDVLVCASIDFDCNEGWRGFDLGDCGCGCRFEGECDASRFAGTSGMAEPFALGARCEFLIACSQSPLADGLSAAFLDIFSDARCGDGSTFGCPDGTASFCEAYIDIVDQEELAIGCALSVEPTVERLLCGGDL